MLTQAGRTSPPRIAVLLPDLRPGGAERLHVDLAHSFQACGVETTFVVRQKRGELLAQLPHSSAVADLNAPRVRNAFLPLVRYLKTTPHDALLAAMWPLTVLAPLAARFAGYRGRVVISEHSPLSLAYARHSRLHRQMMRLSQRIAYPLADARVAVSTGVARDLAELAGLSLDEFQVIHNPAARGKVDSSAPRPGALRGFAGPVILSVGTLKTVKRHDLLLEAFARLPVSLGARLCLLGDGDQRAMLVKTAQVLGIEDRLVMPGFVADPGPWYACADLFVLCSDYEGFGNVIVEALEYGVPVVSTDCPVGPAEILDNGRFGTLVPASDAEALALAMIRVLGEDVDRDVLRARARDFDLETIARRYLAVCLPTADMPEAGTDKKHGGA